jgi:hypothetical protein
MPNFTDYQKLRMIAVVIETPDPDDDVYETLERVKFILQDLELKKK